MIKVSLNKVEKISILILTDFFISSMMIIFFSNYVLKGTYDTMSYEKYLMFFGIISYFLFAYIMEMYSVNRFYEMAKFIIKRYFVFGLIHILFIYLFTVFFFNTTVSRFYLFVYIIGTPIFIVFFRYLVFKYFIKNTLNLSVGYIYDSEYSNDFIRRQIKAIEGNSYKTGYKVRLRMSNKMNFDKKSIEQAIKKLDLVIIDSNNVKENTQQFLYKNMYLIKRFETFNTFYEKIYEKINFEYNKKPLHYLMEIKNSERNPFNKLFTAGVNLLLCLIISVVLILIIPFIIVINIFLNRGPLLYSQYRIGKNGLPFKIYKFRSMVINAEKNGEKMASANDSRVTFFGKIMRQFRIDELPQILSIIKGDMNLIGPRPEREIFVKQLNETNPFYNMRHFIKPGLTGWAQVKYKYGENLEDSIRKMEYDLYYIKNQSIAMDLKILFKTVTTVIFSRGM